MAVHTDGRKTVGQIYDSNAGSKFPLADWHAEAIPDDVLLDMSITVPHGVSPVLGAARCGGTILFLSVEDSVSGNAVGHFSIVSPSTGMFYDMVPSMAGARGWVVPGPGASRVWDGSLSAPVELDPSVVVVAPPWLDALRGISVDGLYSVVEGHLSLGSGDGSLDLEVGEVEAALPWLEGARKLPAVKVRPGSVRGRYKAILDGGLEVDPVLTVAGVKPDEDGNIQIIGNSSTGSDVEVFLVERDGKPLGVCVHCGREVSFRLDPVLRYLEHGRCGESAILRVNSSPRKLPTDPVLESLNPNYAREDCGCPPE